MSSFSQDTKPLSVRLVAAGPHECVPHGVPLRTLNLPSLHGPRVQRWLSEHACSKIFVVPGDGSADDAAIAAALQHRCPACTFIVSAAEYRSVLAMQPY